MYIHLYIFILRGTHFDVVLKNQNYKHKVVEISALQATFQFQYLPKALTFVAYLFILSNSPSANFQC